MNPAKNNNFFERYLQFWQNYSIILYVGLLSINHMEYNQRQ